MGRSDAASFQQAFRNWHALSYYIPPWCRNQQLCRQVVRNMFALSLYGCEKHIILCRSRPGLFLQHPNPLSSLCPGDPAGCGSASLGPSWTVAEAGWKVRCHGGETSDPGWGMARRKGALPTTTGLQDTSLLHEERGAIKIAGAPSLGSL